MNCKHPNPVNMVGVINQSSSSIIAHINSSVGNSTTFQSTRTIRIKTRPSYLSTGLRVNRLPSLTTLVSRKIGREKEESSAGLEPATSRLTVERANQLRHEDLNLNTSQMG